MTSKKQRIKISDLPQDMNISGQELRNIVGGAPIGSTFVNPAFSSALKIRMGIESWRSPDLVSRVMNPNKLVKK